MIPTPADAALMLSQSVEISLLAKATAFLLVGLTAVGLARRTRASVRHLILAATFAAIAATPLLINSVPETRITVPIAAVTVPTELPVAASVSGPSAAQVPIATPADAQFAISSRALLQAGWLIGSLLFLNPLVTTLWKLRSLRRTALPCIELSESVLSMARESGFSRHIDVLQHENVASPITFGVWRPVIILPAGAVQWGAADLRRALTHEIEHIRRADWMVHLTARTTAAVYWFHPLAWIAWRQLVLEAEQACDDAVVVRDERTDYAEQLVTLAQRLTTSAGPALGMAQRSDLAARVSALLDDARPRGRVGIRIAALTITCGAVIVLGLAPLRAVAVAQEAPASMNQPLTSGNQVAVTVPLSYQRDQQVLFGDEVVSLATLADRLRQTRATAVILRGDKQVQLQALMQVMDQLKTAGVERVAIVDRPEKPRRLRALDRELVEAAQHGDLEDVKDLIDAGASVDAAVQGDGSPLIVAARSNRLAVVVELLNRGADVNLAVSGDGNPLIAAAMSGAEAVVDLLLSHGAAIDLVVPGDENALIQAAGNGHFAIVKMLVERGADVNARVWADRSWDSDDRAKGEWRTPLGEARKEGHRAVVEFLLRSGARE
jgi:beta-lactamase regulating signal transducer with metallopeptidase domain